MLAAAFLCTLTHAVTDSRHTIPLESHAREVAAALARRKINRPLASRRTRPLLRESDGEDDRVATWASHRCLVQTVAPGMVWSKAERIWVVSWLVSCPGAGGRLYSENALAWRAGPRPRR